MNNPWKNLPQAAPFLLSEDAADVTAFNARCKAEKMVHTELPPEPYAGRRDAPVVLLMRRPSYHPDDAKYMLKNAEFAAIVHLRSWSILFIILMKSIPKIPDFTIGTNY